MSDDIAVRMLRADDRGILAKLADGVFDRRIDPELAQQFVDDPRHHLAVAIDGGLVVGMASAVDYVHPDKPRQLWINEIGVADAYRRRGTGKRLLRLLLDQAVAMGCTEAWVLTDSDNQAAKALYGSMGASGPTPQQMYSFCIDNRPNE